MSNGSCDEKMFLLRSFDEKSGMNELAVIGGLGLTGVAGVSGVVTQPLAVRFAWLRLPARPELCPPGSGCVEM